MDVPGDLSFAASGVGVETAGKALTAIARHGVVGVRISTATGRDRRPATRRAGSPGSDAGPG